MTALLFFVGFGFGAAMGIMVMALIAGDSYQRGVDDILIAINRRNRRSLPSYEQKVRELEDEWRGA